MRVSRCQNDSDSRRGILQITRIQAFGTIMAATAKDYDFYYAHTDNKASDMCEPSAPPVREDKVLMSTKPVDHGVADATGFLVSNEPPLPPSHQPKRKWCTFTFQLMLYHIINFAHATVAYSVVLTIVCVAVSLIPLCGLGIFIYLWSLHLVRWFAKVDVAMANMITPAHDRVRFDTDVPDQTQEEPVTQRRLASRLQRFSWRSTYAVFYFLTIKFVLGIASAVVVCLPFLPIASQIVHSFSDGSTDSWVAGYEIDSFNFDTDPVWYTLTCVGYIVVGFVLIHVVGHLSRHVTRAVCCE